MPDPPSPWGRRVASLLLALLAVSTLAPAVSALDVSTKAIRVVGSAEYPATVQSYSGQASGFSGEFNGEGIAIAILDTGVDDLHPTFEGAFVAGARIQEGCASGQAACMQDRNALTNTGINPDDQDGHGTHVASIALGRGGPGVGPRGVASGARLVDVKIASDIGSLSLNGVASGIRWVIDYNEGTTFWGPPTFPVKVISISFASSAPVREKDRDEAMKAVQEAWQAGILVVAAAGNCGPGASAVECAGFNKANGNMITSPGAAPEAITVGAIDDGSQPGEPSVIRNGDTVAPYSSHGPNPATDPGDVVWRKPDVVAPGSRITAACASITPGDQQGAGMSCTLSGTSMATPHVSGIAAILFQAGRAADSSDGFSAKQVKDLILNTAEDWSTPGWDASSGYGYVDGYAALVAAINRPPSASFVYRPVLPEAGEQVEFDASVTRDPDDQDTIERFIWDFGDGTPPLEVAGEVKRVEHTYTVAGAYTVRLTAYDDRGASDEDVQTVQVNPPPPPDKGKPPVPVIKFWPKQPRVGQEVHFDASNSTDPDGDALRQFHWDFAYDDDFDAAIKRFDDPKATHTFELAGVSRVALRVVDDRGLSAIRWITINIAPPPPGPPVVTFTNPKEGDVVQAGPILVAWTVAQDPADAFTLFIDGVEELTIGARQVRVTLSEGKHTLRLVAVGPGGQGQVWVNVTAVDELLSPAAQDACAPHAHDDPGHSHGPGAAHTHGADDPACQERGSATQPASCAMVTHNDGRTEQLCGNALYEHRQRASAATSTDDDTVETPLPPFVFILVALLGAAWRRRRRVAP